MSLKDFIPPIVIELVKKLKGLDSSKEYESYSKAIKNCTSEAYQNIELCNMIADKTNIYKDQLKKKPYTLNQTNVFLLSAINQYINTFNKTDIKVLDFGGACGAHYFETKHFIHKNISLKWYVVDTEQMVDSAIKKGLNNDELFFVNSLDNIDSEIDFIYSSCALHYVSNPYEYTNQLLNIKADWMLINRMMFNENDRDFVTIQKSYLSENGPGMLPNGYSDRILSYPHTTLSFKKFNSTIINDNYNLEWIFEESTGSHKIGNEKIIGKGLLYVKK